MKIRLILFVLLLMIVQPTVAQNQPLEDCILIIGDSIPAGHAVSQVPGYGFPVIVSEPFSRVLHRLYNELNITHIGIHNLAVGASSLGGNGNIRYQDTVQFAVAQSKHCQFAVIFPWINDLPENNSPESYTPHIQNLTQLVASIRSNSPRTQIVILDYYRVVVTELGSRVYGTTISPAVIGGMNQAISAACSTTGIFGANPNVSCLHIEPFLLPLDAVLMNSVSQAQFTQEGFRTYDAQGQSWLTQYWSQNAGASIPVDGVHLNSLGKRRLAMGLNSYLQSLNPSAFQTVAPF